MSAAILAHGCALYGLGRFALGVCVGIGITVWLRKRLLS
jgi:hypothetical protein